MQPHLDDEVDRRGVRGGAGPVSQHWLEKALPFPRLRFSRIKGAEAGARRAHGRFPGLSSAFAVPDRSRHSSRLWFPCSV